MSELVISEVFGPTIQGEGASAGRRAAFVRLGRCNLDCSWCDTPFTWDWQGKNGMAYDPGTELRRRAAVLVAAEVVAMDTPLVVITGGEPLLQRSGLITLTQMLAACGRQVEIETNGTRPPLYDDDPWARPWLRYNVSPKLANSGIPEAKRDPGAAVRRFEPQVAAFKFVVGGADELEEVAAVVGDVVHPSRVWIMPEGRTPVDVVDGIAALAGAVVDRGWNLSSRLHVLAWGDQRGH